MWWRIFILVSSSQVKRKSVATSDITIQRQETIRSNSEAVRSRDISGLSKLTHKLFFLSFFKSMTTMTVVKISNDGFNQPLKMFLKLHFTSFKVANRWRVNVLFVGVELIRRRMDEMQKLILLWARLDDVKIGPKIGRIDWSWVRIYYTERSWHSIS